MGNNRLLGRFEWAGTRGFSLDVGRAAGRDAPLLAPFVRILAISNNEQQEWN